MDVFVNKTDQFCQVVIGFRTSNSHDDKQQLKSAELPQPAAERVLQQGQEPRRAPGVVPTAHAWFHAGAAWTEPSRREESGRAGRAIRASMERSTASAPLPDASRPPKSLRGHSKDVGHAGPAKGQAPSELGAGLQGAVKHKDGAGGEELSFFQRVLDTCRLVKPQKS